MVKEKKKKKGNRFRDRVAADAKKQRTSGYGYLKLPAGIQMFNEEPGERVKLDVVPYEVATNKHPDRDEEKEIALKGDIWYKFPFKTHRNVGANNETVVCPTTSGKKCPLCEYRKERAAKGADQEELRELNSSRRNLYLVVPRDHKKYKEEIHLWDVSAFCFQNMLDDELRENPDNAKFADPEDGLTLKIRFSEESIGKNKFAKVSRIDFEEREPLDEDLLKNIPNLDDLLTILPYEKIDAKFMEAEEEDEDEEKGEGEKKDRKSKKKVKPKDEDEEEEDDDEEEEEDDEEDDSDDEEDGKSEEEDDDEEEEEDSDDEDEEEDDEESDDDEEDEEEGEEDDEPSPKKKSGKKKRK